MNLRTFVLAACASSVFLSGYVTSSDSFPVAGHPPIEISRVSGTIAPGERVSYRIVLEGVTDEPQSVSISAGDGAFEKIPSQVTVQTGDSAVTFAAILSTKPPTSFAVSASCNGGTVMTVEMIPPSVVRR
jgi:hypothetical protein